MDAAAAVGVPYLLGNTQTASLDLFKSVPKNNKVHIVQEQIAYTQVISQATQDAIAASGGEWELGGVTDIQFPVQDWPRSPKPLRLILSRARWSICNMVQASPSSAGPIKLSSPVCGHGKMTLLRSVAHLLGWQSGSIKLSGEEIGGSRSTGPGRKTSSLVPMGRAMTQQGDAIFPGLSVRQHLDCGAYSKLAWRERRDMVLDIFPPLRKLEDALVGKLSGGERRMVSVGRALMVDASLYLIDEPSLGLTPKISASVIEALFSLPTEGRAMVIAEQNVALLSGQVDRRVGIHAGRIRGDVGHVGLE